MIASWPLLVEIGQQTRGVGEQKEVIGPQCIVRILAVINRLGNCAIVADQKQRQITKLWMYFILVQLI